MSERCPTDSTCSFPDGAVAVIRGLEVARGIDRQALWVAQIRGGEDGRSGGDGRAVIACGVVRDDGVVAERDINQIRRRQRCRPGQQSQQTKGQLA